MLGSLEPGSSAEVGASFRLFPDQVRASAPKSRTVRMWTVADRLKDRGTFSFSLKKRPAEMNPQEAAAAADRLESVLHELRRRAGESA